MVEDDGFSHCPGDGSNSNQTREYSDPRRIALRRDKRGDYQDEREDDTRYEQEKIKRWHHYV